MLKAFASTILNWLSGVKCFTILKNVKKFGQIHFVFVIFFPFAKEIRLL